MYRSFGSTDMLSFLESEEFRLCGGGNCNVHIVRAGKNPAWDHDTIKRLKKLQNENAACGGRVYETVIENSGHWVHVEALDAVIDIITEGVKGVPRQVSV